MGNYYYISQSEPVRRESAFLFVPPSRFSAFIRHWETLRVLPSDEFDELDARQDAWLKAGPEGRIDPVENAAMEAFLKVRSEYRNYHIHLVPHDLSSVRGVGYWLGEPTVNCCIIKLDDDHKMRCGFDPYIKLLGSIAPFVDDAVIVVRDDYSETVLRFHAGALTYTSTDF